MMRLLRRDEVEADYCDVVGLAEALGDLGDVAGWFVADLLGAFGIGAGWKR